jgi:hypothetical protein
MTGVDHDNQDTTDGMESQQLSAVNIDREPLFGEALLAATQRQRHSHTTGTYTEKED